MSFQDVVWLVAVVLVPVGWLISVPIALHACAATFGIAGDAHEGAVIAGSGFSGFGAAILAGISNSAGFGAALQHGALHIGRGSRLVALSVLGNSLWIGVQIGVFALNLTLVAAFEPDKRTGPLWSAFLVSWLAGFFAFCVVAAVTGSGKGKSTPHRGRKMLSGKEQAAKRAKKKLWRM